jgi:hypothetical protein
MSKKSVTVFMCHYHELLASITHAGTELNFSVRLRFDSVIIIRYQFHNILDHKEVALAEGRMSVYLVTL